jgi:hypothetical protein
VADDKTREVHAKPTAAGASCQIRFTPDGGIDVVCDTKEATRKFVDAALAGKVTVSFVPRVKPGTPAPNATLGHPPTAKE